jgi:hypothetical protein
MLRLFRVRSSLGSLAAVAGALGLLPGLRPAAAQAPPNTCADPYWADTMRCRVFPGQPPQPAPLQPAAAADVKDFTRVDLTADWSVRCADGTRPIVYVDPAVGGPSNRWLITFTGGGACSATDEDGDGVFESGGQCAAAYADAGERDEMGTATKPAMKNLGTGATSQGIMKPDPAVNPVFAAFNRVRVEKCSYDRYNGRATHAGVTVTLPGGATGAYTLFNHGRRIAELALDTLRGDAAAGTGLAFTTWVAQGGAAVQTSVSLPPLEAAEVVLFVGHSGGAHGLMHNVDALADHLRAWPAFRGDVRALFDANFIPAIENEAAFDGVAGGDLYDHRWSGDSAEAGAYDGAAFFTASWYADQYDAWRRSPAAPLAETFDRSCVEAHEPAGDAWKCRDRHHVLLNHVATPFFVREDFSDPNREHADGGHGHMPQWGEAAAYPHCAALGETECPPLIPAGNPSPYRDRLETQARTALAGLQARSELALGQDASGPAPTFFLWMPDCGAHEGAYDDEHFYEVSAGPPAAAAPAAAAAAAAQEAAAVRRRLRGTWSPPPGRMSMRELVEQFMLAPPAGARGYRIDGFDGATSVCP